MNWKNRKVLVTGSEGLIGRELVIQLKELGAKILHFDVKVLESNNVVDIRMANRRFEDFKPEYVFNLFGVKGNPKMTKERPVDFMYPMLVGDANIIMVAQMNGVKRFLYTSSIAVENPESDKYPAWAKMTAETLIEAMRIQYPKGTEYCIVRPANVYGSEDLSRENLMVVSSLIKQSLTGKILVDKKGLEQTRDLIHAKDVAKGMIKAMEEMPKHPVNLCSGKESKIKDILTEICKNIEVDVVYKNLNLVLGPDKKVMKNPYIKPQISLEEGIKEIIQYEQTKKRKNK